MPAATWITLFAMAHKLILSEAGRIQREDGSTLDLTKLLGDAAAVLNTYTQTYSTASRTSASVTTAAKTDNSGGTIGTTIAAGVGISEIVHPLTSLATGLSTAAIDLLTTRVLGYKFKLLSLKFTTTVAGTGSSASQVFNLAVTGVAVTGGVCTVTLGQTDTIGKVTSGTAISAANTGAATDSISLKMAASGTVFTAGAGYFTVAVQNMDTADAFASIIDQMTKGDADLLADKKVANAIIDDLQSFLILG